MRNAQKNKPILLLFQLAAYLLSPQSVSRLWTDINKVLFTPVKAYMQNLDNEISSINSHRWWRSCTNCDYVAHKFPPISFVPR